MQVQRGHRMLAIYATVTTLLLGFIAVARAAQKVETFDEITVHRINVTEPDGKLRLVISNHARLPGVMRLAFLDENGKVLNQLLPSGTAR